MADGNEAFLRQITEAIALISEVPGYEAVAAHLENWQSRGRIKVNLRLPDRARAGLWGTITLGPEILASPPLSVAQTLVHEHFHIKKQHPLLKSFSFWMGVFTRTHPMLRYERPAYTAALCFLKAAELAYPTMAPLARAETAAIRQVFQSGFGATLTDLW